MQVTDINGYSQNLNLNDINETVAEGVAFTSSGCSIFSGRVFTIGGSQYHLTALIESVRELDMRSNDLTEISRIITVFSKLEEAGYNLPDYFEKGLIGKAVADIKHWYSKNERKKLVKSLLKKIEKNADQNPEILLNLAKYHLHNHNLNLAMAYISFISDLPDSRIVTKARELFLIHYPLEKNLGKNSREDILLNLAINENSSEELCYQLGKYHWRNRRDGFSIDLLQLIQSQYYLELAYKKNHPLAAYELYLNYHGTKEEKEQWFAKAIELREPRALTTLRNLELLDKMEEAEMAYLLGDKAQMFDLAKLGYKDAIFFVAKMDLNDHFIEKHIRKGHISRSEAEYLKLLQGASNELAETEVV